LVANKVGPYGQLFWSIATFLDGDVPIAAEAGPAPRQPVLPWLMVAGMSALEIALILYRLRHTDAGLWVTSAGFAVAVFPDYSTRPLAWSLRHSPTGLGAVWPLWALFAIALVRPSPSRLRDSARLLKGR